MCIRDRLETMFKNRVDLGLGRAPGTDMMTASALRRDQHNGVYAFPEEVAQLQKYFGPENQQGYVRAYPAVDKNVPLYILGSSTDSAHLAARMGLPYVFAGHFAPQQMREAMSIYKELFEPSEVLDKPYMIVCLNAIVAETDEEAEKLATTLAQVTVSITRGRMEPLQPPIDNLADVLTPAELQMAKGRLGVSLVGSEETVKQQIEKFMDIYGEFDELMAISYIYDQEKQKESFERLQRVMKQVRK